MVTEVWDTDHFSVFIQTVKSITAKIKTDEDISVEAVWVLSLSLKVLSNNLKKLGETYYATELFEASFIQCLVYLSSKGTDFSQQWLIKDLEVNYSINICYSNCTSWNLNFPNIFLLGGFLMHLPQFITNVCSFP